MSTTTERPAFTADLTPPPVRLLLGNWLAVELLAEETHSAGGVAIPETARKQVSDALVLAAGPGRVLDNGRRYPLCVEAGDRVVFQYWDLRGRETLDGPGAPVRTGFLADGDVVAVKRWRNGDWLPLEPAHDWCLLVADPLPTLSAGGIALARYSAGGAEMRVRREAEEAWRQIGALAQDPRYQAEPDEYYRHRRVHDLLTGLSPAVREAVYEIDRNEPALQEKWKRMLPYRMAEHSTCGTLTDVGPGAVGADGQRKPLEAVRPGDRVEFRKSAPRVYLGEDGQRLIAVRVRDLDAVIG